MAENEITESSDSDPPCDSTPAANGKGCAGEAPSPKEELEKLKEANQTDLIKSNNEKKLKDSSKKDIEALDKQVGEIDAVLKEYQKKHHGLKSRLNCIRTNYKNKKKWIKKEIPCEKRREIKNKIRPVTAKIEKLRYCIPKLKGEMDCGGWCENRGDPENPGMDCPEIDDCGDRKEQGKKNASSDRNTTKFPNLVDAEKDLQCSVDNHARKEKALGELKGYQKKVEGAFQEIEKKLKKIESLCKTIEKEGDNYDIFFYIKEVKRLDDELFKDKCRPKCNEAGKRSRDNSAKDKSDLKSPEELKQDLHEAWGELRWAKKDLGNKQYAKNMIQDTLETTKSNYNEAVKSREEDILEIIRGIPGSKRR